MKVYKPCFLIFMGVVSLLIFGLLISQSFLAILHIDYVKWPVSVFLSNKPILFCIIMGIVAGLCEEFGYFFVFAKFLRKEQNIMIPLFFSVGRVGLESVYSIFTIIFTGETILFAIVTRVIMSAACIGLTYLDYFAARKSKLRYLCGVSVCMHALINAGILAIQRGKFPIQNIDENSYMLCLSTFYILIFIAMLIYYKRKGRFCRVDNPSH